MKHSLGLIWVLIVLSLVVSATCLEAQTFKPFEPGQVSDEDVKLAVYPDYPDADAAVLKEFGKTRFVADGNGLHLLFRNHSVIKIFTREGFSHADVSIPLYVSGTSTEKLVALEATTWYQEGGKLVKKSIDLKNVFYEVVNENLRRAKFTLPAVTEGCVIEYIYSMTSDFMLSLRPWRFQQEIPVRSSEYSIVIPEFFDYNSVSYGFFDYSESSEKQVTETFHFLNAGNVEVQAMAYKWRMENIPPFVPEPFMTSPQDYMAAIVFQLSGYRLPGQTEKTVMQDWPSFANKILVDGNMGEMLSPSAAISELASAITKGEPDPLRKAEIIYTYLRERLRWNGEYGIFPERKPDKVLETGTGSVAEINGVLIAMLSGANLQARPVLASTRDHGKVLKLVPLASNFNYMLVTLTAGEGQVLLDLSEPTHPPGELPFHCLNGEGFILQSGNADWVKLHTKENSLDMLNCSLSLSEDGKLTGKVVHEIGGLRAASFREREKKEEPLHLFTGWETGSAIVKEPENYAEKISQEISLSRQVTVAGDRMYLAPMQGLTRDKNPFVKTERVYPVDIGLTMKEVTNVTISIPPGWTVEELPKNVYLSLPEDGGKYRFNASFQEGTVQFISTLSIHRPFYPPAYFKGLYELFDLAVSKHAEQLVLKKQ